MDRSSLKRCGVSTISLIGILGVIQGGASPYKVDTPVDEVQIDPYGPSSPEFVSGPEFAHMWVSALAHCQARYEGMMPKYHKEASGGGLAASQQTVSRFLTNSVKT